MEQLKKYYDVLIVGGGIGGLMAAHRLTEKAPQLKVCLVEQGNSLENRKCPIVTKQTDHCIRCKSCAIMEGLGGRRSILRRKICHLNLNTAAG